MRSQRCARVENWRDIADHFIEHGSVDRTCRAFPIQMNDGASFNTKSTRLYRWKKDRYAAFA